MPPKLDFIIMIYRDGDAAWNTQIGVQLQSSANVHFLLPQITVSSLIYQIMKFSVRQHINKIIVLAHVLYCRVYSAIRFSFVLNTELWFIV